MPCLRTLIVMTMINESGYRQARQGKGMIGLQYRLENTVQGLNKRKKPQYNFKMKRADLTQIKLQPSYI
jgi:hypothetical protein